jgi:Domain of unknown function (DUF1707)/Cell wall-active antibiotics response 4TMS YvqF
MQRVTRLPYGRTVAESVSDDDRERTAELLQKACGDGRLTLEEFSVRVGAAWAAETSTELALATAALAPAVVGTAQPVDRIVTVFSESKRKGRWRLRGQALRTATAFGTLELDLREVLTDADVIEVTGTCWFGEVKIIVPEGVEVALTGRALFASRELQLAPVPRVPGTPLVRVEVNTTFSSLSVRSQPAQLGR